MKGNAKIGHVTNPNPKTKKAPRLLSGLAICSPSRPCAVHPGFWTYASDDRMDASKKEKEASKVKKTGICVAVHQVCLPVL